MIRTAVTEDAAGIAALAIASGLFPVEEIEIVNHLMSDYFTADREAGHECLVDEDGGLRAVAYAQPAVATDRTWYLTMIGVHADQQGRGRGTALLTHLEQLLTARRQRLLLVETSGAASFERTRNFYLRCGYEPEGRVRDYYEPGDDMVLFRKVLA